ncbi:MAG: hypothetical protein NXI10_13550 [bacterium]|nr:hypothetical protein [bacterium]
MKKLIEKEDWMYYVYEVNDKLTLEIPIGSPPPGFDVIHVMTEKEKSDFLSSGITVLEKRIRDMKENFNSYELNPWR